MRTANRKRLRGSTPATGGTRSSRLVFIIGGFVCSIVLGLWVYHAAGVSEYLHMLEEMERLQHEIQKLEESNVVLRKDIAQLEQDSPRLEELARNQLGLVREGEVVYQLVEPQ